MQHSAHVDDRLGIPALISPARRRSRAHRRSRAAEHSRSQVGLDTARSRRGDTPGAGAAARGLSHFCYARLRQPRLQQFDRRAGLFAASRIELGALCPFGRSAAFAAGQRTVGLPACTGWCWTGARARPAARSVWGVA